VLELTLAKRPKQEELPVNVGMKAKGNAGIFEKQLRA